MHFLVAPELAFAGFLGLGGEVLVWAGVLFVCEASVCGADLVEGGFGGMLEGSRGADGEGEEESGCGHCCFEGGRESVGRGRCRGGTVIG